MSNNIKTDKKKTKKKKAAPDKRGKKPLWNELDMPSKLESVRGWALHGATDIDMCKMLGISKDTFYKWKKEHSDFAESVKKGKDVSNGELLNSAFLQAMGQTVKEQQAIKVKKWKSIDGVLKQEEEVVLVEVDKYIPPNPTMSIFMIKNRLPEDYKDKQIVEQNIKMNMYEDVSDEELEQRALEIARKLQDG